MMKNFADLALLELHQMGEILDVIEMLPTRSEPKVSTAVVLGYVWVFRLQAGLANSLLGQSHVSSQRRQSLSSLWPGSR